MHIFIYSILINFTFKFPHGVLRYQDKVICTSVFLTFSAVAVIHCSITLIGSLRSSLSIGWLTSGRDAFQ